jgi:hypothetical protein
MDLALMIGSPSPFAPGAELLDFPSGDGDVR